MNNLVVVNSATKLGITLPDANIISARDYLIKPEYGQIRSSRVYNLCTSFAYQSLGYYVSLLAAARGHRPMPNISTLLDIKNSSLIRFVSEDLQELIKKSFRYLLTNSFVLSIYFGLNLAKRYDRLSRALFNAFPAPFIKATFRKNDEWQLTGIRAMSFGDIPSDHIDFALKRTQEYFERRSPRTGNRKLPRFNMAILYNESDPTSPSDSKAIDRFRDAAIDKDISVEIIGKSDFGRLSEFDALLIRETTGVNHHTYRFARKAQAEGIIAIDDADSILKCTNKVYLTELLTRHGVPIPKTFVVHTLNRDQAPIELGFPIILKQPDSSFSMGVTKVNTVEEFREKTKELLNQSELIIAQEYLPTPFDWRIGLVDKQPLYACKYYMAQNHWQIAKRSRSGRIKFGKVETFSIDTVPEAVLKTAVKAASLVGEGLYGVDLKQVDKKVYVIEINENPTIESGVEDSVIKEKLYQTVIKYFLDRLEKRTQA
jgi:glutathione synthase/RimK-type ligase-like ATP-grasp enzyme